MSDGPKSHLSAPPADLPRTRSGAAHSAAVGDLLARARDIACALAAADPVTELRDRWDDLLAANAQAGQAAAPEGAPKVRAALRGPFAAN